jgi:protein involved in polysaccharide export with SLBB domain
MINSKGLPVHEWLIICLLIAFIAVLTLTTYLNRKNLPLPTESPHYLISPEVQIKIEGAVEKPGFYTVLKGTTVRQVLEQAVLLPEADQSRLSLEKKVRDGQRLRVPLQEMITVFIEGAVESSIVLKVPKGTRLQDLIEKIRFLPEADQQKLQKKRRLKDREVIDVPVKNSKKPRKTSRKKINEGK